MSPLSYLMSPKIGLFCYGERLGDWFSYSCFGLHRVVWLLLIVSFIPLYQMANSFSWTSAIYGGKELNFRIKNYWYSRDILEASNFRSLSHWWTTRTLTGFSFMCSREKKWASRYDMSGLILVWFSELCSVLLDLPQCKQCLISSPTLVWSPLLK